MHAKAQPGMAKVIDEGALSDVDYEWSNDGSGRMVRLELRARHDDGRLSLMTIYLALECICDIMKADLGVMESHTTDN